MPLFLDGSPSPARPRTGTRVRPDRRVKFGDAGKLTAKGYPPIRGVLMPVAAMLFALAGTGYGLIGILVIIVLVLVIWRLL